MFRNEAQGRELHFENAGLIGGNEVFRDRESGSRWQQSSLEAISGPMKGEHVKLYPLLLTNWGEWHKLHPDTLVLTRSSATGSVFRKRIRECWRAYRKRGTHRMECCAPIRDCPARP